MSKRAEVYSLHSELDDAWLQGCQDNQEGGLYSPPQTQRSAVLLQYKMGWLHAERQKKQGVLQEAVCIMI